MGLEYWFPYAFNTDWRAVALPYAGTSMSMICVLPNEGEFGEFEAQLDASRFEEIVKAINWEVEGSNDFIYLRIPKFSFDSDVDLKEPLSHLGMTDAFKSGAADFLGITSNDPDLFISTALQKTHIAIDEIGTVAVAAAGEVFPPGAIVPSFFLDRPFLFFIWDDDTQTVLFVGRLVNPDGPVSKPTNIEPPVSDAEAICGMLDELNDSCGSDVREITEQQCIESLTDDDSAIVEQCADCYRAVYDSCGGYPCFCDQVICVDECPSHPF
jgi:hypothetical protein